MAIDVKLHHLTRYRYDRTVQLSPHIVRLRPAAHTRTPVLSYSLKVTPADHWLNWQQDTFGNYLARLVFPEPSREFSVEVNLVARMAVYDPFDFFLEPEADGYPFTYGPLNTEDLRPYRRVDAPDATIQAYLDEIDVTPRRTIDFLVDLNQKLQRDIKYLIRMEPGVQSPTETLQKRSGSCRDTGWLLVTLLRHLGLAARFVSGYLIQLKPDEKALDGPSGSAMDFTDLHAWTEVFLPGAGWVGLDPTSGLLAGEGHIPLACTPEPRSASPIEGGFTTVSAGEAKDEFHFEMDLQRVFETPRVTLPYTDAQWSAISQLGHQIDERLRSGDVRLSMGGEPTFVSIDDFESPEWTSAALGNHKRERAEDLMRRLFEHYGKGGFLHYGQGKWYPGEQLPRWAYACVWRKDGQPVWQDPNLLGNLRSDDGATPKVAEAFANRLCEKLRVTSEHLLPAYEDAWYYLWKERRLPTNVNPLDSRLDDEWERERLAKIFERGLDRVTGYTLPLERGFTPNGYSWISGPWFFRPETMFLIPGDSPMGYRLPLDSLPWMSAEEARYTGVTPEPFELPPLPDHQDLARQYAIPGAAGAVGGNPWDDYFARYGQAGHPGRVPPHLRPRPQTLRDPAERPAPGASANWLIRTALCVEPREGNLFVFLPPVPGCEDYLDLLAAVEATAADLGQPVVLEGYLPPADPRLQEFKLTPDPGVIEVNIHPAYSWEELAERTEFLYEAARQSRLTSEKFLVDGRHTGTGGGNHIVVGGETVADSPLLRKPELLSSLIRYWHQHPGLSYLFSGLFIGPTSQAPRLDEARNDSIYELEIAQKELERQTANGRQCPPWLVDRLFRNLLTDVTGNTHRAEFCIDKLFTPESHRGRLGLLELRAFEMPPHARMSLVQQLLLRGLISRFWEQPFETPRLTRWGTDLHDRWMLPHYVMRDMEDVAADLTRWGMPFDSNWLAPHYEFRFPKYGEIAVRDIHMELRQALEPWHVLGEDPGPGGTVRYVDSSVERLQVKVTGLNPERYALACNGQRVPLQPTGINGEFVAGIRYKAWQPPMSLHPTIPADTPLVFDLVDLWNETSLGGCRYHVAHPGGRGWEDFPVNANAAESRRLARFDRYGQTTGNVTLPPDRKRSPDHPLTLDLREAYLEPTW